MRRYQRLQRVAAEGPGKGRGDELQVYGDFLRIVLEILNCIIATNLPANPELVYALLHRQEVFMPFRVRWFSSFSRLSSSRSTLLPCVNKGWILLRSWPQHACPSLMRCGMPEGLA